ncbi:tol-pal system-associated acyl-CoA thioesterase [Bradyrhizobium sp. GCM10023182]|uniref:Tol-pal system-associated acyl-CoA thioesterase n=1 Tax=Bradyrhizobium zhengyangense TaxID=2911009 RepID=A0ABS9LP10_9BRAD|nr:tol-pal system-associated acyl-CoA thioesterase [Bradyrhizobium zhengyangense]MCG2668744.1 tol-pal system-associated acyl-CoA thioesterase [Bradyrhizobium zhengyangense]
MNLDGFIRSGAHHMQVRVYFEDTDFSQIVYHANYLRFMERGRTNYLRLLGTDHRELFEEGGSGFAFVVRSMKIDYFKPAYMDDVIDVITAPEEVRGASITLHQQCKRGVDLLVEAYVRVAFVSGGKAQRIPKYLRDAMEAGTLPSPSG